MPKAILVCVLLFASLSGLTPAAADQPIPSPRVGPAPDTTEQRASAACLQAIEHVIRTYGDKADKPLPAMAVALVRRCNGHPVRAICEQSSDAMLREFGKTPFTCGANTADSVPLILPVEKPAP